MSTVEQLNQRSKFNQRCWQMVYTRKKFCIANLSHASLLDFSPFSKKNSRPLLPFSHRFRPPAHKYTMNRFENDNLPDCACVFAIMNPQNNKLAPSLNFFGVDLYSCCDVLQSQQSQSKGRSSLPPLDTGSESNLIIGSSTSWNNQLEELTKLNLLENKQLG